MSLSIYYFEDDRHLARLHHHRRRRRAYAPTSNTASHDNHEKITSWVTFSFLYGYGAPLGDPSGRRSSANRIQASVVRKPISANPRLNRPNPRNKFVLRLNSVPRSSISAIQGLNSGLNLTHLARWINSLIG